MTGPAWDNLPMGWVIGSVSLLGCVALERFLNWVDARTYEHPISLELAEDAALVTHNAVLASLPVHLRCEFLSR